MSLTQTQPRRLPLWPAVVIVIGLNLTLSWMMLLGFGLFRLSKQAVYVLHLDSWATAMLTSLFSTL